MQIEGTTWRNLIFAMIAGGTLVGAMHAYYTGMANRHRAKEQLERAMLERTRAENGYTVSKQDLNGNGLPETFVDVEGKRYYSHIDDRSVEDVLHR